MLMVMAAKTLQLLFVVFEQLFFFLDSIILSISWQRFQQFLERESVVRQVHLFLENWLRVLASSGFRLPCLERGRSCDSIWVSLLQ